LQFYCILAERAGIAREFFRTPLTSKGSINTFPGQRLLLHVPTERPYTFPWNRLFKQIPGAMGLFRTDGIESLILFAGFWLAEMFPWIRIFAQQRVLGTDPVRLAVFGYVRTGSAKQVPVWSAPGQTDKVSTLYIRLCERCRQQTKKCNYVYSLILKFNTKSLKISYTNICIK
jgi:hypothetical protein